MSTSGSRGGSSDALGSLLADLGGVEGDVFSRPKAMAAAKKVPHTSSKGSNSQKPPLAPSTAASSFPSSTLAPSPLPQDSAELYRESHSINDLEAMLNQGPSSSAASLSTMTQPQDYEEDPLNWGFQPAADPPATSHFDDPFADFGGAVPTPPPPPPLSYQHNNNTNNGSVGKGGPHAVVLEQQQQQQQDPLGMFGGFPPHRPPPATTAKTEDEHEPLRVAVGEEGGGEGDRMRPTSSSSMFISNGGPSTGTTPHRAFQLLDEKQQQQQYRTNAQTEETPPFPPRGGGSKDDIPTPTYTTTGPLGIGLGHPSSSHPPTESSQPPHSATEGVVDLGHKAAKVLQAGTKWFVRASKQIATEVQKHVHQIQEGRQQQHPSSASSFNSKEAAAAASFYYDWASQISRMSPGTRVAALGAMQEEDRLEVQRILDEAELGERVLGGGGGGDGVDGTAGTIPTSGPLGMGRLSVDGSLSDGGVEETHAGATVATAVPPPPPPSYDEVMARVEKSTRTSASPPLPQHQAASEDLLGMDSPVGGKAGQKQQMPPPSAHFQPSPQSAPADLLHMDDGEGHTSASHAHTHVSTSHIDDMFSIPKKMASTTTTRTTTTAVKVSTVAESNKKSGGVDSMIDLGEALSGVDTSKYNDLYAADGTAERASSTTDNEPEIRRILRERRIAEKHERMKQQLAEARARDEAEEAEKSGKVALRESLRPKIDAWSQGKKDNIRALLSTLHTVLWEGSGWTAPSIADIVEPGKVKKWYMKANLVVHPDKVKQKGGTLEHVTTADMVFDVLKAAWGKFESNGR